MSVRTTFTRSLQCTAVLRQQTWWRIGRRGGARFAHNDAAATVVADSQKSAGGRQRPQRPEVQGTTLYQARRPPQQKWPNKASLSSARIAVLAGAPFVLFSVLAAWVVSNAIDGKLREMETAQGQSSQSLRQAALQQEHDEMMDRLNKITQSDFDNTTRIKRPHEILAERGAERQRRNVWYRRWWRAMRGKEDAE